MRCALAAIAIVPIAATLTVRTAVGSLDGYAVSAKSTPDEAITPSRAFAAGPRRIDVGLDDRAVAILCGSWMLGVFAFALRIGMSVLQLARLARRSTKIAERRGVGIYASGDIVAPLALGFVVPAILIPATLDLACEEFECVVLHELAHVRRGDLWANASERALHALLFFNPFVALTVRAIAFEREVACDDWAVVESRDLDAYARSLASFAIRMTHGIPARAYGATGFGHRTLARIDRLENSRRNGAVTVSRTLLGGSTIVFALIALTVASFAPAVAFSPLPSQTVVVATNACTDLAVRYLGGPAPAPRGRLPRHSLTSLVRVRVSSSNELTSAAVYKSSGVTEFDRATIAAAKRSTWAAGRHDCRPVGGTYVFRADFSS